MYEYERALLQIRERSQMTSSKIWCFQTPLPLSSSVTFSIYLVKMMSSFTKKKKSQKSMYLTKKIHLYEPGKPGKPYN